MKNLCVCLFAVSLAVSAALAASGTFAPSAWAQKPPLASISVETGKLGVQIPEDFVGISLEVSAAGQGVAPFAKPGAAKQGPAPQLAAPARVPQYALGRGGEPNDIFFQFLRNLGPGVLRLGGNSQDNTCWKPASAPHPDWCKGEITTEDFRLYSQAAKSSGWRLIVGMNLKQNSASWAVDEVKAMAKEIAPEEILGLEIGNEPDHFARAGRRPESYSPADLAKDFRAYAESFQKDPVARKYALVGPAVCSAWRNANDLAAFLDGVGPSTVKLVTVHAYPRTTCRGNTVTTGELLAPELVSHFNEAAKTWVAAGRQRNLPVALAETNSAACGGMPGVSNSFASAPWGLDWLFSAAEDGFSGLNFHIGYRPGGAWYNPVDTYKTEEAGGPRYENIAEPLYYAMYAFAKNASGEFLLPATVESASNIRAYATTACADCAIHVAVLNKDLAASGPVLVRVPGHAGAARLLLLRAPKLESLASEVTYGGEQFDRQARIAPRPSEEIRPNSKGEYEFHLPNAAIAFLAIPAANAH